MNTLNRRKFLCNASLASLGVCTVANRLAFGRLPIGMASVDKLRELKGSHIRLGIAAYSFREHFAFMKGKPQSPLGGKAIDMFSFIDYCATQQCAAELTSYFFPPDADESYFRRIKRHAFLMGVPIVGTAIGNNFTVGKGDRLDREIANAKAWIEKAEMMGAPHIRFFAGTRKQLESAPDMMKHAIASLQVCVDFAASKGIFVGVENHGHLTADQVLQIVDGVKSDWLGVNLDTGNFVSETPYADLRKCAPFAVNVQLKTVVKSPSNETSKVDLAKVNDLLNAANYRGYVVVEFEESDPFDHVPEFVERSKLAFQK